jgi:hypothetical protein
MLQRADRAAVAVSAAADAPVGDPAATGLPDAVVKMMATTAAFAASLRAAGTANELVMETIDRLGLRSAD